VFLYVRVLVFLDYSVLLLFIRIITWCSCQCTVCLASLRGLWLVYCWNCIVHCIILEIKWWWWWWWTQASYVFLWLVTLTFDIFILKYMNFYVSTSSLVIPAPSVFEISMRMNRQSYNAGVNRTPARAVGVGNDGFQRARRVVRWTNTLFLSTVFHVSMVRFALW